MTRSSLRLAVVGMAVLALAVVLHVTAGAAGAAPPIFTPPVQVFFESSHTVSCLVVNVSLATRTVTVDLLDQSATVQFTQTVVLSRGQAGGLIVGVDPFLEPVVYCRFTAMVGKKGDIRGAIAIQTSGGPIQASLPAE